MNFGHVIVVGLGGFVGAVGRHWVSGIAQKYSDKLPMGTLSVNLIGSFLLGLLATLMVEKMMVNQELRLLILVGVLGAFTTYSTFSLETLQLIRGGSWMFAGINIAANVIGTLIAVWAGVSLAKLW